MSEAATLAGGPGAPAPAPAVPALALAPLPAELGAEQAQAELSAMKGNPALVKDWLGGEPNAVARFQRVYAAAFDQPSAAAADPRDPAPERASGYALPLPPAGVAVDQRAVQPLMAAAHAAGLGRAGFQVLAERTFALAGGERPHTAEECGGALERWYGEAKAREVLAAAQRVAQRALQGGDAEVRAALTALSTDPYAVAALGEHELRRAGR